MAGDWRELPGAPAKDALFRLRLRRLDVVIDPRGKPEYYGAHVALLDSDPPVDEVIEVNRPLIYRGFHAYQQSYQPDYRQITSVSFVVAKVRRGTGAAASPHGAEAPTEIEQQISLAAQPGADVAVPGTALTLRILRYFPHWTMPLEQTPDGRTVRGAVRNASDEALNPAIEVRFETPGREPFTRWIMLPFQPGQPRQGGIADYGDYRVMPVDFTPDYATWLTFKTHPVMLPVWVGCGAMMLGIVLCFYCNHERIWALVRAHDGGECEVLLAGNSFKWRERFHERFRAVAASLESERGSKT